MAQLTVPSAPKEYATQYRVLLGVDYRSDQTEVDRRRSPDMVNMISDFGGNPVKRDGYRVVAPLTLDSMVQIDDYTYVVYRNSLGKVQIAEVGMDGYELDGSDLLLSAVDVGDVKAVFAYKHTIYVVGAEAMYSYDVETGVEHKAGIGAGMMSTGAVGETEPANYDAIPLTLIGLLPDGTGGTALDGKNVMSIYQQVSYKGDGTSATFAIPNYICTKMGTWVKVEVVNANTGEWEDATFTLGTSASVTGSTLDGELTETNNIVDATVTLTNIPPQSNEDNVRITFAPYSMEDVGALGVTVYKGYYNEQFVKLLSCNAATFQSNRMFIADKYRVYYSELYDPFRISDLSWFEVDSEIVGFTRSNSYLLILTKDTGKSTIYLAQEQMRTVDSTTGETETYFAVKESNAGIGAIAPKAIATLSDEPMFLSNTGAYGILTNWQSEKYAVNRSARINKRLCQEHDLDKAVAVAFNDYLYIAVNGRMYVLDGRHKESDRAGNKPLEAYVFEGLPAIENMWVVGDRMYFADDEKTYTWNDDLGEGERYLDNGHLEDDVFVGEPVCARWCSVFDDDGAPQRLKTLMKKGSMVTLVPHYKSGCEITLVKDGDQFEYLGSFDSSINSFENIDFNSFTFNSNTVAIDTFTKKKVKKYKRLQIQIENNKAEPFGLTQITKTYTFGNYAKR